MVDARAYHERTKHTPAKLRETDFELDFDNQPRPYKRYLDLPAEPLASIRPPQIPALSAIAESTPDPLADADQTVPGPPDRETIATLCYLASGIISSVERHGREVAFRAAACTGKLYHVDCYLVCGDLDGLDAGVYHYDPRSFALDRLRAGDHRGLLASAAGGYPGIDTAPVTIVTTSTWWRNAWKYRDRTYRHAFWDSGTILANLLATAHALDYRAEVVAGFADEPVAELLGVEPEREAPLELVPIGREKPAPDPRSVDPIDPATEPLSDTTVEYPLVHEAWEQSSLADGETAAAWREQARNRDGFAGSEPEDTDPDRYSLDPVDAETATARPLYATIQRRGSCREFAAASLGRRALGTILDRATRGVPGDWDGRTGDSNVAAGGGLAFTEVYLLLTDVDGVPDGAYRLEPADATITRVGTADDQIQTNLALGQSWAGDANANVYVMADVDAIVEALGNRGYRLAQLEAGIVLGRLYLATYAHRTLGGTGLTFFDDLVTEHFSPAAGNLTPMTLFALGHRDSSPS